MSIFSTRRLVAAVLATSGLVAFTADVFAQQIEEIIVTTRKRAENLQDVPIVIQAFTAQTLLNRGISDIEDLTKFTPGVSYDEGLIKQDIRISIRGLSPTRGRQNAAILMDDVDISSEAILTAGGSMFINPRLFDLERLEVIKGPHSALYGRSAFAGAINYITKKPGDEFAGNASFEVAQFGKLDGRVSASGPVIADKLSIGGSLAVWHESGMYSNSVTGKHLGGTDGHGYSLSAVWTPIDALKFTIRGEHSNDHFDPAARSVLNPGTNVLTLPASAVGQGIPGITSGTTTTAVLLGIVPSVNGFPKPSWSRNPRTGADYPGDDRKLESAYLRTDLDLGAANMVALSYYGNSDATQFHDTFPNGDAAVVNAIQESHFVAANRLLSQDVRFQSSDSDGPLNWAIGGLAWWEVTRYENRSNGCFSTVGGCVSILSGLGVTRPYYLPAPNVYYRDTHHHSVYGLLDYKITDQFTLSAEFRNSWEDEKISSSVASVLGTIIGCPSGARLLTGTTLTCLIPGPQTQTPSVAVFGGGRTLAGTKTQSQFHTPRFTAEYQFDDDRMVYVSAAKGQKPGGVLSLLTPTLVAGVPNFDLTKFKPEILWVYELGLKAEWLDGRARTNTDVYWQDFTNKQETGTRIGADGLPATGPGNAEKARVKGFEFDGALLITDNLTTSLGYSYIDAKYRKFNIVQSTATNIALAGNCVLTRPAVGTPFCNVSYAGRHLVLAPKHSGNISLDWHQQFASDVQFFVEADGRYMGRRFATNDNQLRYNSFKTVDARTGFRADHWQVTGYINNLFKNDEITTAGTAAPNFALSLIFPAVPGTVNSLIANLPDKRQFGLRMSYTY